MFRIRLFSLLLFAVCVCFGCDKKSEKTELERIEDLENKKEECNMKIKNIQKNCGGQLGEYEQKEMNIIKSERKGIDDEIKKLKISVNSKLKT